MEEFLDGIGPETRERPSPTVKGSIVAAAATLVWLGTMIIAIDNVEPDSTNVVGAMLGLLAAGIGHAILVTLRSEVRPAGIALIALGTVSTVLWIFDDLDTPTAALFILTAAYLAQWAFGPAKGATTLLTLSLLAAWAFVIDLAVGDPDPFADDPFRSDPFGGSDPFVTVPETSFTSGDDTASYLSLLIGAGLLLAVRALDRRGWHGVATSAVIVGDVAFVVGVFGVIGTFDSDEAGSLLVLAAGVVLAVCAVAGGRRFTVWLGGIGVFAGLISFLVSVMEPDSAVQFGVVCMIVGAVVIGTGAFLDADALRSGSAPTPAVGAVDPGAGGGVDAGSSPADPVEPTLPASPPVADEAFAPTTTADATRPMDVPPTEAEPASAAPAEPAASTPAEPAASTASGWYPDPTGAHELRYHDGSGWTTHVSDAGVQSTDEGT